MLAANLPVLDSDPRTNRVRYSLILVAIAAITLVGYFGFIAFLNDVMPAFSRYSLYLIAIVAGIATFFSPCSFPLLPGYLSFYYNTEEKGRNGNAVYRGVLAALGIVSFNLILGTIIAFLGEGVASTFSVSSANPSQLTRIFRITIGLVLASLGALQLYNFTFHTRILDSIVKKFSRIARSKEQGLYFYGFGYNLAGVGCAGPIMAGLIVFALGLGGLATAFLAFVVYSLTMVSLMLGISLLIARSKSILIGRLKASTPNIKRATSTILVAVGVFLIYATVNLQFFVQTFFPK